MTDFLKHYEKDVGVKQKSLEFVFLDQQIDSWLKLLATFINGFFGYLFSYFFF